MKILMPLYPCEGCCDQCYALNDLRVFFDTAYCEYCWGELSESNWPLWDDAEGAVRHCNDALPREAIEAAIDSVLEAAEQTIKPARKLYLAEVAEQLRALLPVGE
jgi:hypothetical protein